MTRILVELRSLGDWQSRLGDPQKHWKRGASAMELAVQWVGARGRPTGVPSQVNTLLDGLPCCTGATAILVVPERCTPLPGAGKASQSDLFVLLKGPEGFVSLCIEGKAREPFGDTVDVWLGKARDAGANRQTRLEGLCTRLGLNVAKSGGLRYQLLHRTAATLIEAERWNASAAVMLVERFADAPQQEPDSWTDFAAFAEALGCVAARGAVARAAAPGPIPLYLGWVDCNVASDQQIASALE